MKGLFLFERPDSLKAVPTRSCTCVGTGLVPVRGYEGRVVYTKRVYIWVVGVALDPDTTSPPGPGPYKRRTPRPEKKNCPRLIRRKPGDIQLNVAA